MCSWSTAERVLAGEGLAERVDRRGADVAEDDADGADRQLVQRSAVRMAVADMRVAALRAFGFGRAGPGVAHVFVFAWTARVNARVSRQSLRCAAGAPTSRRDGRLQTLWDKRPIPRL